MQFVSETYNRISNVINMAFSLAKIAPLYRQVRQAISNGTTPKTDEMAAKLLDLWLGKKVYEAGSYVYVDAKGNVDIAMTEKPKEKGIVRFVILSDTHECHHMLSVPKGDVLIHTGDFLMMNALFGKEASMKKIKDFNNWLGEQPHEEKFVICGNHDSNAASLGKEALKGMLSNATYLENDVVYLKSGISIFGTPASKRNSPFSPNDAFQYTSEELQEIVNKIPENIDVLMSHGPPDDLIPLNNYVNKNNPAICIFGHIHERNTSNTKDVFFLGDNNNNSDHNYKKTIGLNGATIGRNFDPSQVPVVYDYNIKDRIKSRNSRL